MPENLKITPSLHASMRESPLYRTMGVGLTDRIFLIGHADGLELNNPYPVADMQQAINSMGADTDSPLLRSLLEAYFSGARDVWLIAAAPMSEYQDDLALRDEVYYQTYYDRLEETYRILEEWDVAQIVVPVEAPFNSTVDFLGQLIAHCHHASDIAGTIHLGFMGTRGTINQPVINAMSNDGRLSRLGAAGKFVSVFVGDAVFNIPEMELTHTGSAVVAAAAEFATLPLGRGLTYRKLRNVIGPAGYDLTKEQQDQLTNARLNPIIRNTTGRRGTPFNTVFATDNTLAPEGSDYWSLAQIKLVSSVSEQLRRLGNRHLGGVGMTLFKNDVLAYLNNLSNQNAFRTYSIDIQRAPGERNRVQVYLALTPYFGIRQIYVQVEVGPSQE